MSGFVPSNIYVELKKLGWVAYLIAAIVAIASGPVTIPILLVAWFWIWILKPKELQFMKPGKNSYIPEEDMFDHFFGWAVKEEEPESWSGFDNTDSYQRFRQSDYYKEWDTHRDPVPDNYTILELGMNASENDIKVQYRKMLKKYHPDLGLESERAERTRKTLEIIEAYHSIMG